MSDYDLAEARLIGLLCDGGIAAITNVGAERGMGPPPQSVLDTLRMHTTRMVRWMPRSTVLKLASAREDDIRAIAGDMAMGALAPVRPS